MSAVHRSSPQAAWVEPGSQAHQALLAQFMVKSTALASKAGLQDPSSQLDAAEGTAGVLAPQRKGAADRGYRSQPSSPARTRRELHALISHQAVPVMRSSI